MATERTFDNTAVYVLFAFYMCITFGIAIYGMKQRKQTEASGVNQLEAHFLADKGFGVYVTSMNLIASLLTGYVVVGIPGDTATYGYFTMSYIGALVTAIAFMAFFWPRLGGLARKRRWLSPNDLMADRYNSKTLRLLTAVCGCGQLLFITAIEWMAMDVMLRVAVQGDMNPKAAVWVLASIVFVCEMMGGMSSVALTDAVQATFLVLSFILMPMLIADRWGGLGGFVEKGCSNQQYKFTVWPESPPAWGTTSQQVGNATFVNALGVSETIGWESENGEFAHNQTLYGCVYDNAATRWFLWTPPVELTQLCFSVMTVFISWPIQPMAMHRVMVARDGAAVKASILSFALFPCVIFLPGVVMGMAAAAQFPWYSGVDAFMVICQDMFNQGGFYAFVATLFMTSSIAAFMSTSDSIVLAVSNTLTVDLLKNWAFPKASMTFYLYSSKLISLSTIILGVVIGLYSGLGLFDFVNIAQGFMNCILAPYYIGLYWDKLSANACCGGTVIGLIVLFTLEYAMFQRRPEGVIMGDIKVLSSCWCAIASVASSIILTLVFEVVEPKLNDDNNKYFKWDDLGDEVNSRYGETRLTVAEMNKLTAKIKLPSDTWLGWGLFAFAAIAPAASLPWGKDPFVDEGMIGPFPKWAGQLFIFSMLSMCASAALVLFLYTPEPLESEGATEVTAWAKKNNAHMLGGGELVRRISRAQLDGTANSWSASGGSSAKMNQGMPGTRADARYTQVMPSGPTLPGVVAIDSLDEMVT